MRRVVIVNESAPMMVRETLAQWDDVPAKVIGRRRTPVVRETADYGLQTLVNELHQSGAQVSWPKGIFRFKTHAEADAWWIRAMKIRN